MSLVVATPGRLLDHLQNTQSFETSRMSWLILDEGDRLLDMGFAETVHKIIALLEQKAAQRGFR